MENPTETCRNCHHPLPEGANFCPSCGQKNTDGRLSFRELFGEFVGTFFNLDNRVFSTLGALAIPGKLTQNYFEGKHVRYYHPVRLFLISAGIFTALMTIKVGKAGLEKAKIGLDERKEEYIKQQQEKLLDSLSLQVSDSFRHPIVNAALDTLTHRFKHRSSDGSPAFNYNFNNGEMKMDTIERKDTAEVENSDSLDLNDFVSFGQGKMMVAMSDLMELDEQQLLEKYHITGWFHRLEFQQRVRIAKGGSRFIFYMIGNTIWMVLIMMPLLALVLKLLYIRRRYYYYEHLVFSFHTHAFVFLLFALLMALDKHLPDAVQGIAVLFSCVYLFLAMKRFYRQGFFKTFLKFSLANTLYLIIATLAGILTLMASAVFY